MGFEAKDMAICFVAPACSVCGKIVFTSYEDAKILDKAGAIGAVVGVAIYTGLMSPWEWEKPWLAD